MKELISGHIFEQHGQRLTVRKSWWWFVGGCALALVAVGAGTVLVPALLRDPNVYVGGVYVGGSRFHRGRVIEPPHAIDPAHQTAWQKTGRYGLLIVSAGFFFLLPAAYVVFGSEDQRVPMVVDRGADRITRGPKVLCKASDVVAIRLVEARGGTGVFARLKRRPWSIELGCFSSFRAAEHFATPISRFLGVGLHDDPIMLRGVRADERRRGFEVLPPKQ